MKKDIGQIFLINRTKEYSLMDSFFCLKAGIAMNKRLNIVKLVRILF